MSAESSAPTSAGPSRSGARRRLSRTAVLVTIAVIAVVLLVVDQVTKNWAEANLPLLEPQPFLGEFLQLTLLYNTGAAWGMGEGITPVVTCLQIAIVIGVIVFAVRSVRSPWYTLALGLIMGGALGNIHDRLLRAPGPFHGAVVDFLQFGRIPVINYDWPVFNIADMAVVGGAILVILLGLLGQDADPARAEAEAREIAAAEAAAAPDDEAAAEEPAAPQAPSAESDRPEER
ncbi:signal peptidase II [Brachybacterium aquaticum]|uniref:Lipoprotein signal peptidase n=1 Tax=Brachybacterium aquaticum TaxID=1432564 RepID=A0A841A9V1_9MICO|nr:signal peptidase II [Brachybacterium aquaticum]MBB5831989.1 signal peptidase II [Brachybacterium aquaticum]